MDKLICNKCNKELEISEFYKCKDTKNGYKKCCKTCSREYARNLAKKQKSKDYIKQHKGLQINIISRNIKATYGTVDVDNCKSFFININGWMNIHQNTNETQELLIKRFDKKLKYEVKPRLQALYPDITHSYWDFQPSGALIDGKVTTGYFSNEMTLMLSKPIKHFKSNTRLRENIENLVSYISDLIGQFDEITTTPMFKKEPSIEIF